jgi:hypothetical protein
MTDMKMIDKLCEETGATIDQAQTAFFRAKGDYYLALGYLREGYLSTSGVDLKKNTSKTGGKNMSYPQNTFMQRGFSGNRSTQNTNSNNSYTQGSFTNNGFAQNSYYQNTYSFDHGYGNPSNANKRKTTADRIADKFNRFMTSYLAINNLRIPLLLALICFIGGFRIAIPAIIIAIVLGVKMKFDGPLFSSDSDFSNAQTNFTASETNKAEEQGIPYQMPPRYDEREYEYAYANNSYSGNSNSKNAYANNSFANNSYNNNSYTNNSFANNSYNNNPYTNNSYANNYSNNSYNNSYAEDYTHDIEEEKGFF